MRAVILTFILSAAVFLVMDDAAGGEKTGEVSFNRNDKVLTWQMNNNGDFNLTDKMDLKVESVLSTSLNIIAGEKTKDRWYDTVKNGAELKYRLSDKLDMDFSAHENWNKDTMSMYGASMMTTDIDGGIRYRPLSSLSLNADVGHVYDKRFENRDSGNTLSGGVNYNDDLLNTLSLKLEGTGKTSNLNRSQDGYRGAGNISYNHGLADVSLSFDDNLNRRGYYSNIGRKEIEKRKRHERTLKLAVNRGDFNRISEGMAVEFAFNIQRKDITDTADKKDNPLKYQTNVKGDAKGFDIKIGKGVGRRFTSIWEMEYSKNDNGVERKNRRREQTDVATKGSFFLGIGRADTVEFVGWIARTRSDTPAGVANDRDELKFESGVLYTSHFIDNLKTELDFRVLQTHFVNIDVSQSAQNKWMKTYLLSPALVYSPLRALTVIHRVNLYANYITYDFDSDFSPRSNISRRVTSESSIDLALSSRTILKTGAMFEENDYGKLDSKGNKIPSEEGLRRSFDISIEYRFADWLTLSPMYIYAVRHDWSIEADTTSSLRREIDQTYGLDCLLFRRENGSVIIRLKRIIRNTRRYPTRIRNYITVALNYGF